MERGEASPAAIYEGGYDADPDVRRAFDVDVGEAIVARVQRTLAAIRPEVAGFFRISLSGDEGPGFVRYLAGGFYRRHCDVLDDANEEFPRRIAVVLFLTTAGDAGEGGALRVYQPEAFDILPKAGTLVAFPSDMPHEVLPVIAGVRDVVVDWFF
jgi:predicted 2-oxoglutarate/Fe(II)-dependent dioxygenase YbiX